jgi:hypothetical protein
LHIWRVEHSDTVILYMFLFLVSIVRLTDFRSMIGILVGGYSGRPGKERCCRVHIVQLDGKIQIFGARYKKSVFWVSSRSLHIIINWLITFAETGFEITAKRLMSQALKSFSFKRFLIFAWLLDSLHMDMPPMNSK